MKAKDIKLIIDELETVLSSSNSQLCETDKIILRQIIARLEGSKSNKELYEALDTAVKWLLRGKSFIEMIDNDG